MYDEHQTSLQEAVDIKQGQAHASRVTHHEVADVKAIRAQLHVSQAEFANTMGTSVDTIRSWETERRNPTGLAAKVMTISLHREPPAIGVNIAKTSPHRWNGFWVGGHAVAEVVIGLGDQPSSGADHGFPAAEDHRQLELELGEEGLITPRSTMPPTVPAYRSSWHAQWSG
ncbi:NadS family protein [Onishia taeanensis]